MRRPFLCLCLVVAGAAGYLAVMVVAGQLFATVNEVGDFPADPLWFFRRASLFTLATMWGVIGVVLTGLVGRLYAAQTERAQRRRGSVTRPAPRRGGRCGRR